MKKLLLSLLAVPALASAQYADFQLVNGGFEGEWVECVPWTSGDNTKGLGTRPENWNVANVIGLGGLGATVVAQDTTGYNSNSAVCLTNRANSIMPTQIVPGYLTLGTPWNTSVMGQKNDGGTFGGVEFTGTPDAVTFMYKRTYGVCPDDAADNIRNTYNAAEPFTVVAYSWIGSTWQENVPGNIVAFGNPAKVKMKNRDRNILGIETSFGEDITYSEDFKLVCSLNDSVEGGADDWTSKTLEFAYTGKKLVPEMFNIVFSAGNYFENVGIGRDNSLTVDDVKLLYYSRLKSVTVAGEPLEGFSPDKYTYYIDCEDMGDLAFDTEYEVLGYGAKDNMNATSEEMTITVTNPQGVDADGLDKHVYHFFRGKNYSGLLNISLMGEAIAEAKPATIIIAPTSDPTLVDFLLPDFELALDGGDPVNLGTISVPNMEKLIDESQNRWYFRGAVADLSLGEGSIHAKVDVYGYYDYNSGAWNLKINVLWLMDPSNPDEGMPVDVRFYTEGVDLDEDPTIPQSGIENVISDAQNAPVEYFNLQGIRIAAPAQGQVVIRRAGNTVEKVVM